MNDNVRKMKRLCREKMVDVKKWSWIAIKGSCHVYQRHVIQCKRLQINYKSWHNFCIFLYLNVQRIFPLIFFFSPYLNHSSQLKPVFVNFGEFVTMMSSKVLSFPARSWVFGANTLSPKSFKLLPGLNQAIEYQSNAIAGSVKLRVQQARTFSCSSSSRLVSQMPTTRPSCSNTRHFKIHSSPLIIPKQAGSGVGSNFLQKSSFSSSASAFAASASNSGPSVFYRLSRGISFLFYTAVVVGGIGIFVSNLFGRAQISVDWINKSKSHLAEPSTFTVLTPYRATSCTRLSTKSYFRRPTFQCSTRPFQSLKRIRSVLPSSATRSRRTAKRLPTNGPETVLSCKSLWTKAAGIVVLLTNLGLTESLICMAANTCGCSSMLKERLQEVLFVTKWSATLMGQTRLSTGTLCWKSRRDQESISLTTHRRLQPEKRQAACFGESNGEKRTTRNDLYSWVIFTAIELQVQWPSWYSYLLLWFSIYFWNNWNIKNNYIYGHFQSRLKKVKKTKQKMKMH